MGEVHRARDTRLGRDVALKVLPDRLASDAEQLRRFEQEAQLASSLNHPNIVTIYDIGQVDQVHYIAMELVEGQTVRALLRAGALPMAQALSVAAQIADGLAKAHAAGVVHRDLKPENVMVTKDGFAKILDFGLGKLTNSFRDLQSNAETMEVASVHTTPGAVLGTYALYVAGASQRVGGGFSFGPVFLRPHAVRNADGPRGVPACHGEQTMSAIITEEPPRVTDINPHVPERAQEVIERCLAKDAGQRYASTFDLARDVRIASGAGVARPVTQVSRRVRSFLVRHAIIGAIAVLVLAVVGWLWLRPHGEGVTGEIPTVAVLPLANLSGNQANDYLGIGIADTLTSDLAGLPAITVVSRTSSTGAAGGRRDLARIARDLGVSFVVDGSTQESDGRLKVTVRLVRRDGSVAGARSFEGSSADLFAIQRQLAQGLTELLELRLSREDRQMLERQPTTSIEAFAEYAQGRSFLERLDVPGNLDRAITLFTSAAEKDRGFALAHAGLGEAYWLRYQVTRELDWTAKARAATLEALRLDPDQAAVRHSLAVIYRGTGDTERAIEELRRELVLRSNSDAAHVMLGDILSDKGDIDAAQREYRQAIALRPSFWGSYDALGLALYRAGRYPAAAAAFERVIELQPDNANGYQRLGTVLLAGGDTAKALVNYQRALQLAPTPKAYANLGFIYYRQRRFAEAAEAYRQALALDPASHITFRNLGDVYQRMGRRAEAVAAFGKAADLAERMLQINPKDAVTLSQQSLYQAKLDQRDVAERHASAAARLAPADGQVLYNLAVVHALAGRKDAALAALSQALAHGASVSVAREDDDLSAIRDTAEFARMTKG